MIVYTDSTKFAQKLFGKGIYFKSVFQSNLEDEVQFLAKNFVQNDTLYEGILPHKSIWKYLFAVEYAVESQFDQMINLCQMKKNIPSGILCIAGSGKQFHGFRNRVWNAKEGNIHLTGYLSPWKKIENFAPGFLALSAVSVLNTIDSVPMLQNRAMLKWVNDILIDGSKVSGVLAHTFTQGETLTDAIIGIGLNVEVTPSIEPDPFVPKVASLLDFVGNKFFCSLEYVLHNLILNLESNYKILANGGYNQIFEQYKKRSIILNKNVSIYAEDSDGTTDELYSGKCLDIGTNLELTIEGNDYPVYGGRLVLKK